MPGESKSIKRPKSCKDIKKQFFLMSVHDLGLLILLLSPGMILSILLLITFAEGG